MQISTPTRNHKGRADSLKSPSDDFRAESQSDQADGQARGFDCADREAITYFHPIEEREIDRAPLSIKLIRRIWTYTHPYRARRNRLFFLTFFRGLQLPALAWMIGQTINGPIAGRDMA